MSLRRRGLRFRLLGLVAITSLLVLAALAAAFNIAFQAGLDNDADKVLRARAAAALDTIVIHGERLIVPERRQAGLHDAPIWIYSSDGAAIERGPGNDAVQAIANRLGAIGAGSADEPGSETRLLALTANDRGHRVGAVVAALSTEAAENSATRALVFSLVFVGLAALMIIGLARLLVDRALRPVTEMTRAAADWTEHDLAHRFNAGEPHDELTALASTFDGMLDQIEASLRRERRFSAEISHELRTPLAAILAEAELTLRRQRTPHDYRGALGEIATKAIQLERILDALLMAERGRDAAGGNADPGELLAAVATANQAAARARGVNLDWVAPDGEWSLDAESAMVERILSPLIENACRHAESSVMIEVRVEGGRATFSVVDDGPGVDPSVKEAIFDPGFQGTPGVGSGAGLGLPLARRLARALGGEVSCHAADLGARFEVTLPVVAASPLTEN